MIDYCLDGGLQAVLSEYAHILREALGHLDRVSETIVPPMAEGMYEALSVRAANYSADDIRVEGGDLVMEPRRLRARYALRFGTQSLEDESELQRAGVVRTAFNSPLTGASRSMSTGNRVRPAHRDACLLTLVFRDSRHVWTDVMARCQRQGCELCDRWPRR